MRGRGILISLVGVVVAAAAGLFYLSGEPNSIAIQVNPQANLVDRAGSLVVNVSIENVSLDPVVIQGVGLDSDLLDGVTVQEVLVDSQPVILNADEKSYPLYGSWTEYELDSELAGGRTMELTFTLSPQEAGAHAGDVTVWIEEDVVGVAVPRAARERLDFEVR